MTKLIYSESASSDLLYKVANYFNKNGGTTYVPPKFARHLESLLGLQRGAIKQLEVKLLYSAFDPAHRGWVELDEMGILTVSFFF